MIDWIVGFSVATFTFNSIFGFVLYWVPMLCCAVGYSLRTMKNYRKDIKERVSYTTWSHGYSPTDSVGTILGRFFICFIPIANLVCTIADIAPSFFGRFFDWLEKTFNTPIVPDSKKYEDERKKGEEKK